MADYYFKPGKFEPTDEFKKILDAVEENAGPVCGPPEAAGILAYFVCGEDFDSFMECLEADGLTQAGFITLAQAALTRAASLGEFIVEKYPEAV